MKRRKPKVRRPMLQVEEHLGWLLKPIVKLSRDPYQMMVAPETCFERFRRDANAALQRRLDEVGERGLMEDLCGAWAPEDVWEDAPREAERHYAKTRTRLARHARGRAVLRLLDEAHQAVPFSPFFVLPDPVLRGTTVLGAEGQIIKASSLRGEPRARALWRVAGHVAEAVHRPHLDRLWRLSIYANKRAPGTTPRFGALAQQLSSAGEQASLLVERDAAHVRNAVSHEHVRYDVGARSSVFRDDNGWTGTFSSRQLMDFVRRMLLADEVLSRALLEFVQWAMTTNLWSPLCALGKAVRGGNDEALKAIGADFEQRMEAMFRDAAALHKASRRKSAASKGQNLGPIDARQGGTHPSPVLARPPLPHR